MIADFITNVVGLSMIAYLPTRVHLQLSEVSKGDRVMFKARCVGPDEVDIETPRTLSGPAGRCISTISAERARRLAAELLVAAERAERLESDQRAPG